MTDSEARAVNPRPSDILDDYLGKLVNETQVLRDLAKQIYALEDRCLAHDLFVRDLCRVLGLEPPTPSTAWILESVRRLVEDTK